MRHNFTIFVILLCCAMLFGGCNRSEGESDETTDNIVESEKISADESNEETVEIPSEKTEFTLPDDFAFPVTDGSTSTTNLDNAVRSASLAENRKLRIPKPIRRSLTF